MPKSSRETAPNVAEFEAAVDASDELDDHTVDFVSIRQSHSLADILVGLPGDSCQCPHWGYMFAGELTVRYSDREEVYQAGDAFYMTPGHVPAAVAGTEFVQFSPTAALNTTLEHMRAKGMALQA